MIRSWSWAAGRFRSKDTSIGFRPWPRAQAAILPQVVVFPLPCSPTNMKIEGGAPAKSRGFSVVPRTAVSSSRTILTTCWPGVRLSRTAWSRALTLIRASMSLTTL